MSDQEKKGLADIVNLVDKGAGHELAANDLVADVLDRLVIDDRQIFVVATAAERDKRRAKNQPCEVALPPHRSGAVPSDCQDLQPV